MKSCEWRFADQGFFFLSRIIHLTNGFPIPSCSAASSFNFSLSTIFRHILDRPFVLPLFHLQQKLSVMRFCFHHHFLSTIPTYTFYQFLSQGFPPPISPNYSSEFSTLFFPIFVARFSHVPFFQLFLPLFQVVSPNF